MLKELHNKIKTKGSFQNSQVRSGMLWFYPPNPSVTVRKSIMNGQINPYPFYMRPVFVWEPHLTFPHAKLTCSNCKNSDVVDIDDTKRKGRSTMRAKGWTASPRIVYDYSDRIFVFSRVYKCSICKSKTYSYDDQLLNALPYEVQLAFPFYFSYRSGMTKELVDFFISSFENGQGPFVLEKEIRETYFRNYDRKRIGYLSTIKTRLEELRLGGQRGPFEKLKVKPIFEDIIHFSSFDDQNGYFGQCPSGTVY